MATKIPAVFKQPIKPVSTKESVDQFLRRTFITLLEKENIEFVSQDDQDAVLRAMFTANKIGYTNGFKKALGDKS